MVCVILYYVPIFHSVWIHSISVCKTRKCTYYTFICDRKTRCLDKMILQTINLFQNHQ